MSTSHPSDHNNIADAIIAIEKPLVGPFQYNVIGYGATGDGTTNDTTAVQAAITAANSAGGGTVFFPEGTYSVTKLTTYTAVNLIGVGAHASIIKLRDTQNTALLTTNGFVTTDTSAGVHSFTIANLAFDGNNANQASNGDSGCVQIYGYNYRLQNVRIRGGETVGLYCNWGTNAAAPGPNGISMEARFDSVEVSDSLTDGFFFNGPHDSFFVNCSAYNNGAKGFNIGARGNASQIINCHSWGTSQTYGFYCNGSNLAFANCQAEGAATGHVEILKNDFSWTGGIVFASSGALVGFNFGATGLAGIRITGVQIADCTTAGVALGSNDNGGNLLEFQYIAGSGNPYTGTVGTGTTILCATSGGATVKAPILGHGAAIGGGNNTDPGIPWMRNSTTSLVINPSGSGVLYLGFDAGTGGISLGDGAGGVTGKWRPAGSIAIKDGISAPDTEAGFASIYVDTSDGDLKIKYGDGTVKTIVVDT